MKWFSLIAVLSLCVLVSNLRAQDIEKPCSSKGTSPGTFLIRNNNDFDIEVRAVSKDCKEDKGLTVGAGKDIEITAFAGHVYRIYQNFTDHYLTSVALRKGQEVYRVRGFSFKEIPIDRKLCSRKGDPRLFFFKNAGPESVVLSYVREDCSEQSGPTIEPGKATGGKSFVNNVFRVYRASDRKLLKQVIIRPVGRNYFLGGFNSKVHSESFIKAVNAFRSHSNIAAIELDPRLSQTCKWFTDFMAQKDQKRAGHLLREFRGKYPKDMNSPSQRLVRFGIAEAKAADSAEATSALRVNDVRKLGSYFAAEWTSSKTHFRPFYDIYRTKFAKVGFATTESPSEKGLFYGCAIFANP